MSPRLVAKRDGEYLTNSPYVWWRPWRAGMRPVRLVTEEEVRRSA